MVRTANVTASITRIMPLVCITYMTVASLEYTTLAAHANPEKVAVDIEPSVDPDTPVPMYCAVDVMRLYTKILFTLLSGRNRKVPFGDRVTPAFAAAGRAIKTLTVSVVMTYLYRLATLYDEK